MALDPNSRLYRNNLIHTYLLVGELDRAEEELEIQASLHPGANLAYDYAALRLLQDRPGDSLAHVENVEQVEDRYALRVMALYALGRSREADAELGRLQALDGPNALVRYTEVQHFLGAGGAIDATIDRIRERWRDEPELYGRVESAVEVLAFSPFIDAGHRGSLSARMQKVYVDPVSQPIVSGTRPIPEPGTDTAGRDL